MKCTRLHPRKLNLFRHAYYARRVTFELILQENSLGGPVLRQVITAASLLTLTNTELFKCILLGSCYLRHPHTIGHCLRSLRIMFVNLIPGTKHLNPYLMYTRSSKLFRGKGQAEPLST